MKLPKEHIFQKPGDDNCGPCCLAMVYSLKGKQVPRDLNLKLKKKGKTTYTPQLASYLLKNEIKPKLFISNPQVISPAWSNLPKEKIIKNLKSWLMINPKRGWKTFGRHLLTYLRNGGEIELKSYTTEDFKKLLDKGSLLVLCLDEVWLWGHRFIKGKAKIDEIGGETHGHFVVVTKYNNGKFEIYDPYPTTVLGRFGVYWIDGNQLLNASLIWASTILEVKK